MIKQNAISSDQHQVYQYIIAMLLGSIFIYGVYQVWGPIFSMFSLLLFPLLLPNSPVNQWKIMFTIRIFDNDRFTRSFYSINMTFLILLMILSILYPYFGYACCLAPFIMFFSVIFASLFQNGIPKLVFLFGIFITLTAFVLSFVPYPKLDFLRTLLPSVSYLIDLPITLGHRYAAIIRDENTKT
ncbi:MAG: hypothetical protein ACTSRK_05230 [Promethearchaeota archaeon]